ncbi:hypothetical protein GGR50DRAFT_643747 [Xylaria sp. CBS 124048]|nr:hypothetical protein GGR50DRAFT_643747 [Xylaria sp. CBS 124048]
MRTRRQDRAAAAAAAADADAAAVEAETAPSSSTTEIEIPLSTVAASMAHGRDEDTQNSVATAPGSTEAEGTHVDHAGKELRSKLPTPIQFPLVALLSMIISILGYAVSLPFTQGVLSAHARLLGTWTEVGAITIWRLFELALGWFGHYDGYDITALNFISHGPPLYLLFAHYDTPPFALLITVAIETLATYIPFRLLRPLSRAHANPTTVPNSDIINDAPIVLLTTLLAGAIYSVTLLFAYSTYLPTYLVMYFEGLPSLVRAHESTYVGLLPVTIALGFAARIYIFTSAESTGRTAADAKNDAFNPAKATLGETIRWNFLGWSSKTKVAMQRTALAMFVTGVNTFLQTRLTIVGVETPGAVAWSSVWVLASAVTGLALSAVGSV